MQTTYGQRRHCYRDHLPPEIGRRSCRSCPRQLAPPKSVADRRHPSGQIPPPLPSYLVPNSSPTNLTQPARDENHKLPSNPIVDASIHILHSSFIGRLTPLASFNSRRSAFGSSAVLFRPFMTPRGVFRGYCSHCGSVEGRLRRHANPSGLGATTTSSRDRSGGRPFVIWCPRTRTRQVSWLSLRLPPSSGSPRLPETED